ncbi:hypothetical protein [Profundibacter sp.]
MRTDINIVYHLGAPFTDNEQVTWSLRKDAVLLSEKNVYLRRPRLYRPLIAEMVQELQGEKPSVTDQENLLNSIIGKEKVKRLIMTNPSFLGVPAWMFYGSRFYDNAGKNTAAIRNLFPDNPCEFFLGIANPSVFIPNVFKGQKEKNYPQFMENTDLATVRWSDVISRIQDANPDCTITIWCNEDSPVIWPTILHKIAALDPKIRLQGENDIINMIISEEGQALLAKYLADRPNLTEAQRRRLRIVFLERFYLSDVVEEVIDLPGWTDETVEALTKIYDDDVNRIKQMDGVTFLSP